MSGAFIPGADFERIGRALFGEPNPHLSRRGELRYGRHGSLALNLARGVWTDHEAGVGGGVLDLLVHYRAARDRAEAAELLRAQGALPRRETPAETRQRTEAEKVALARRTAVAGALVRRAGPLAGTPAETWLRHTRAIRAPLDVAALGFLPDCPVTPYRPDGHTAPAMIAAVETAGVLTGAHLTFLQPDGSAKAALIPARKMIGAVRSGLVRLARGRRLVVGEGIESALSAWEALDGPAKGLGCVAGLSAGGVGALGWPPGTSGLILAPDQDAGCAGEREAAKLAARAWAAGLDLLRAPPPAGFCDWNDVAQAERVQS